MKKFLLISLLFIIFNCTPNGPEFIDELDVAVTIQDHTINYDNYSTYALADTIIFITNDDERELNDDQEEAILTEIDSRIQAIGWEKAVKPEVNGSDVVILVSVFDIVNFSLSSGWWDWWGWWPGWNWYPPYPPQGGWYPGYPGCCYEIVYGFREGTLLIEMVDPNNVVTNMDNEPDPMPLLWSGALNGIIKGSQENINSRVQKGLTQIFANSQYLNK